MHARDREVSHVATWINHPIERVTGWQCRERVPQTMGVNHRGQSAPNRAQAGSWPSLVASSGSWAGTLVAVGPKVGTYGSKIPSPQWANHHTIWSERFRSSS